MGKRTKTTVTFGVTLHMPDDCNMLQMQEHIRESVRNWQGIRSPIVTSEWVESVKVAITKRVTTYGT